jgi:ABC-type dipeptide/oligopeptide/nickel transport system ATPase component
MIDFDYIVPNKKPLPKSLEGNPLGTPSINLIVGSTGSGKSVTLLNILMALEKLHDFDSGLFVTGNNKDPLLEAITMDITTSPEALEEYITKLKQAKEGTKHILVLDDIQGSPDFKIMSNRSTFLHFLLSHRHYGEDPDRPNQHGVWILATAQTLKNSFSPQIRDQVKNWFIYYPRNPSHVKLYEDLANDPKAMERALKYVKSQGPHSFLFLNKWNPEQDRYYLGFNQELKDLA